MRRSAAFAFLHYYYILLHDCSQRLVSLPSYPVQLYHFTTISSQLPSCPIEPVASRRTWYTYECVVTSDLNAADIIPTNKTRSATVW